MGHPMAMRQGRYLTRSHVCIMWSHVLWWRIIRHLLEATIFCHAVILFGPFCQKQKQKFQTVLGTNVGNIIQFQTDRNGRKIPITDKGQKKISFKQKHEMESHHKATCKWSDTPPWWGRMLVMLVSSFKEKNTLKMLGAELKPSISTADSEC